MIAQNTFDIGVNADFPFAEPAASGEAVMAGTDSTAPDMKSAIEALFRNESLAFEERLRQWRVYADPRNEMEDALLQEALHLRSQLDRVKLAYLEQVRTHIETPGSTSKSSCTS